jgi:hypothetical protein
MEPLSDDDSERLFYKRIFSHGSGCPPELEVLSKDILKKCGGVPLAIITIASLLATDQEVKPEAEWRVLLESIGRGLTEDTVVEDMLSILSLSYYDLPSHLKTCLLYLSMFPEDCMIMKDRLIWMWIAENFVRCDKAEACAFEIGETYFNELVNRNMIMPVYDKDYIVEGCCVHDMVLELICSLSSEHNFVTVLNGTADSMSPQRNVRRLSLQNGTKGELQTTPLGSMSMSKVRSIATFKPAIDLMPSLLSFVVLRVLDLSECDLSEHDHLNLGELGSLLHLRYLCLAKTRISKLPEEIGNLEFLQVLDVSKNNSVKLPGTVIKLKRLMCMLITGDRILALDGLGNLTALEVLAEFRCVSPSNVKVLGSMKRLRKLEIRLGFMSLELEKAFVESLGKLSNIQSILLRHDGQGYEVMDILGEHWVAPPTLQYFITDDVVFSKLPAWVRSHLSQLRTLDICTVEVRQDDLDILASLPRLCVLQLRSKRQTSRLLLVGAGGFRCLRSIWLSSQVKFRPGAMPKAEEVKVDIDLRVAREEAAGNGGEWFDMGMENLPSIRYAGVFLNRLGVTVGEARQAEAGLRKALHTHPNTPSFHIFFQQYIAEGK